MKEHIKNWSDSTYKGIYINKHDMIGQITYKLEGLPKRYYRHELLQIE